MCLEMREITAIKARRQWQGFWRIYRIMSQSCTCGQDQQAASQALLDAGFSWDWVRLTDPGSSDNLEWMATIPPAERWHGRLYVARHWMLRHGQRMTHAQQMRLREKIQAMLVRAGLRCEVCRYDTDKCKC